MTVNTVNWRDKLQTWLQRNPKTISDELRKLREEFVRRFPKEKLGRMTLEEYAVGRGDNDSFSYWLEYKTKNLGRIGGGSAGKTGVWWSKGENAWRWNSNLYRSPDEALTRIRSGLARLVEATEQGRFDELDKIGEEHFGQVRYLRSKPLYLYFPTQFLPMTQLEHIAHFLKAFGVEPRGEVVARNLQLLARLRGFKEFEGFDTLQMMQFIYDTFPPAAKKDAGGKTAPPEPPPPPFDSVPRELAELMDITSRTGNVLLYGPPGTGKTWLVNHFTNYFLLSHNVSPESANEYWHAKGTMEGCALSERARTEAGNEMATPEPAFWWMAANEETSNWSWKTLFEKGEWFFGKRTLASNFEEAQPGDFIFGYQAGSSKQIVALARVESAIETRVEDGKEKVGIAICPVEWLAHPLDWRKIVAQPQLKKSEPVRLNTHGSMFRLSVDEAHELVRLLNDEGNSVALADEASGDLAEFVTFHQSFAYEEFVEGLRPVAVEKTDEVTGDLRTEIQYRVMPGVFRRICSRAEAAWRTRGKTRRSICS